MEEAAASSFLDISVNGLQSMSSGQLDDLPFGVIGFTADTTVTRYNTTESRLAGLPVASVVGQAYFLNVAQCMNNYLVAQRFEDEPEIDTVLPYVLTLRMRPTPVTLRLLKQASVAISYILIQR